MINRTEIQARIASLRSEAEKLEEILVIHGSINIGSVGTGHSTPPKPAVKRGRPKGVRKAEIPVPIVMPEIPLTRASDGVLHGELPTPKRRGRPKGSKNKPKASNGIVVTTELS